MSMIMNANANVKAGIVREMMKSAQAKSFYDRIRESVDGMEFLRNDKTRYLMGAGTGLMGYAAAKAMQDDLSEEEKRKQGVFSRIFRALAPVGAGLAAGYGGYRLGQGMTGLVSGGPSQYDAAQVAMGRKYIDAADRSKTMGAATLGLGGASAGAAGLNAAWAVARRDKLNVAKAELQRAFDSQTLGPGEYLGTNTKLYPGQTVEIPRKGAVGSLASEIKAARKGLPSPTVTEKIPGVQVRTAKGIQRRVPVMEINFRNGLQTKGHKMVPDPYAKLVSPEKGGLMSAISKKLDAWKYGKALKRLPRAGLVAGPALAALGTGMSYLGSKAEASKAKRMLDSMGL